MTTNNNLTDADIDAAMFSSLEGFASIVVGSIEFELGRDLTKEECQRVYRYTEAAITKGLSEPDKLPIVSFYRDGIEAAANWVDQQRESYDNEHGRRDNDTGSFEFGNDAQRDYSDTLAEIAEGIRALHPNAGIPPAPVMPDSENGLMPCPFCGGKARQLTIEQDNDPHFGGDVITCTECGASSHVEFGFKENLKSAWNARAELGSQPQPTSESEDRKMLKRLAVIMSGNDAPGEIRSLTVTAQSLVDRCKALAREKENSHIQWKPASPDEINKRSVREPRLQHTDTFPPAKGPQIPPMASSQVVHIALHSPKLPEPSSREAVIAGGVLVQCPRCHGDSYRMNFNGWVHYWCDKCANAITSEGK